MTILGPTPEASDDLFALPEPAANRAALQMFPARMVLRYKGTVICALLAIALPAIAAIWLLATPEYRARATVEISPTNPRVLYKTEDNGLIPMYQQYLNSQVGIISGNRVLQRVVERKDVQATAWYRDETWRPLAAEDSPLGRLREGLSVSPRGRTFLIDIDFGAAVPQDARVIVDAVLAEYNEETRNRVEDTDLAVLGTLGQTLNELQMSIAGREKVTGELRRELGTDTPAELIAQKRLRLDQLAADLQEVSRRLELARWEQQQLEAARASARDGQAATNDQPAPVLDEEELARREFEGDSEWWRLYVSLREAELQLDVEAKRLGQAHPTIVALRQQIQRTEQQLHDREARLRAVARDVPTVTDGAADAGGDAAVALAHRISLLEKEKDLLTRAVSEQQSRFAAEFEIAGQLAKESEELYKHKQKAELVRARLDEKETERGPVALISVVSRPLTPSRPDSDRRPLLSGLALLLGLAGGLGLAFIRGALSRTIQGVDQLTASTGAPLLGLLPLTETRALPGQAECVVQQEHYRMLRTALLGRLDGRTGMVAQVTSGSAGVGKTTVAVMLAKSLARCGKRVLLVDTDIRAPGVASLMGIRSEPGLMDTLRERADSDAAIVPTDVPGLDVLPAGRSDAPHDTELLANGVFTGCLTRWRKRYDVVLLDSPPVLPVADARILSRHADGTILVVREGHCRQPDVQDTLAFLGAAGGKLLGTVYIGARSSSRYYGYTYPTYGSAVDGKSDGLDARGD